MYVFFFNFRLYFRKDATKKNISNMKIILIKIKIQNFHFALIIFENESRDVFSMDSTYIFFINFRPYFRKDATRKTISNIKLILIKIKMQNFYKGNKKDLCNSKALHLYGENLHIKEQIQFEFSRWPSFSLQQC